WPAEVVALVHLKQLFRWILGVVLRIELPASTVAAELIAAVHRRPEPVVERADRDADRVSNSLREVDAGGFRLALLARVELPDAGASVELRARTLPRRVLGAIVLLTRVRLRADVHVEHAVARDHEVARGVSGRAGQARHDRVRWSGRREVARLV